MSENKEEMTAEEIVAGLRSDKEASRRAAMDALFPASEGNTGGMMIRLSAVASQSSCTTVADANRMFVMLLMLAQHFGKHLGMSLGWTQAPEDMDSIQIARGGLFK